jgi:glutaredoxin
MDYKEFSPFILAWNHAMIVGAILMIATGLVIYIVHKIRAASIKDYHKKYDYLNTREISNYKLVFYCFGVATALLINLYGKNEMKEVEVWFFTRLFMGIAGGTLVAYISYLILEYYYPSILDKKLKRLRYAPRINPKTGNKMRLLSEEEEDVHLEEGMRAEEEVFSVDYDVWIDEQTGDITIEKYPGRLQAVRCNTCGFYTMRVVKEEITRMPSATEPGELVKHYQCNYCKSVRATAFNISTKQAEDYKKLKFKFKRNKDVDLVKVEIHTISGERKHYEFQNVEEAQKFLAEFDSSR